MEQPPILAHFFSQAPSPFVYMANSSLPTSTVASESVLNGYPLTTETSFFKATVRSPAISCAPWVHVPQLLGASSKITQHLLRPAIYEGAAPEAGSLSAALYPYVGGADGHLVQAPLCGRAIFTVY